MCYEVTTGMRKDPWGEAKQQQKQIFCAILIVLNKTTAGASNHALRTAKTYVMFQNSVKTKYCFKIACKAMYISGLPQLVKFIDYI